MTAALLALLLQPPPDEPAAVAGRLAGQLAAAFRLQATDPEGAARLLTALLDDPQGRALDGGAPAVRLYREQALYARARLRLRQGQAQTVAEEMTALLDRKRARASAQAAGLVGGQAPPLAGPLRLAACCPPAYSLGRVDRYQALTLRAAAAKALGRPEQEQADRAEAAAILRELTRGRTYPAPARPRGGWRVTAPASASSRAAGPLFVAGVFGVMLPVFFLSGLRQRRLAGGSWRRLFWVALALAALQTAPVLAAFLLLRWRPGFPTEGNLLFVAFLVFGVHFAWHWAHLRPVRWKQARGAPPLLEDAAVLGRIAQLAGRLGVAPPQTRLVRSPFLLQQNQALIIGLAAPTMVLFDGILHRLAPDERDAVIAHELAHLANHTFWRQLLVVALCGVAAVAASAFYPVLASLCLGVALWTGARVILSRRLELDCDRRAARAIGHRRAASALWKLHADQPFTGLTEFLVGAVATHPPRDQRLAAVRRDAPAGDKPEVEWDPRLLGRRLLAAWAAAGLWLAVVLACLLWAHRRPDSSWPALPLGLMPLALLGLSWLALRKTARRRRRLQRTAPDWRRRLAWLPPVLFVGFLLAYYAGLTERYLSPWTTLAVLVVLLLAVLAGSRLGRGRVNRLNHRITIAIQSGDYPAALALCEGSPAVVAGSPVLRYNHALIRAVLGRREEALADLEKLRADDPRFKMTWLLLAGIYSDEGEWARALELTEQLSRDLPGESSGPEAAAWILRRLGRLDEAEARARRVLQADPRSGLAHFTLAAVALDRGDAATARQELARAERLVPGSITAALLDAEIALATGQADAAAAVRKAVEAARTNPLAFSEKSAARLAARLEAAGAMGGGE
jgi:Zn-dependent protease with chaperone function/tetratricopeptide (TPR) repeat protein